MENELLRCPFCDGQARLKQIQEKNYWFSVSCGNTVCPMYQVISFAETREQAIKSWNTRPNTHLVPLDQEKLLDMAMSGVYDPEDHGMPFKIEKFIKDVSAKFAIPSTPPALLPLKLMDVDLYADHWRLGPKDEETYKITQGVRLALNSRLTDMIESICFKYGTPPAELDEDYVMESLQDTDIVDTDYISTTDMRLMAKAISTAYKNGELYKTKGES